MHCYKSLRPSTPPHPLPPWGWSGGAMVLGKLPVPRRPTIWMIVGQGPIVLAVGAGGGCLDIFTLVYLFFPLSPFLWETARYSLKYCLKGPLNPNQPINQPILPPPFSFSDLHSLKKIFTHPSPPPSLPALPPPPPHTHKKKNKNII